MNAPKVGALFAGYGGLEMAVSDVFPDTHPAWVAEFDAAPSRILAQRFPDVPNFGDVTKVKWAPDCPVCGGGMAVYRPGGGASGPDVFYWCSACERQWDVAVRFDDPDADLIPEPVDIITGGSPCQDLSHAGKRAGMRAGMVIPAGVMACGCRWAEHEVDSCEAASPAGDVPSRLHARQEYVAAMRAIADLNARDRADGGPPPARREAGTRSGLWASMCDAIEIIRPRLVVWENVRGALSAEADSAVEPCPICVGDGGRVSLRALGRVLGDLAELGYDAAWTGLRAADVGAPHGRFRVFVLAWPADTAGPGLEAWREGRPGESAAGLGGRAAGVTLLPSPRTSDTNGAGVHGDGGLDLRTAVTLLPTPTTTNAHGNTENNRGDRLLPGVALDLLPTPTTEPTTGNGHARNLGAEARLLPTPRATDGTKGGPNQRGSSGDLMLPSAVTLLPTPAAQEPGGTAEQYHARLAAHDGRESTFLPLSMAVQEHGRFGQYAPAIARWEAVLGRPAPAPTESTGKGGAHRLSPRFVEWLMGLPDGWVTDTDTTRNEQLKALGNGAVPQQAAAAVRHLLGIRELALTQEMAA